MEKELTKLYYSIGEVAKMFDVSQSLLRYWETEFPRLKPGKTRNGNRKYTKKDILYIEKIYDYVKLRGYTLEGARKAINKNKSLEKTEKEQLVKKLKEIRSALRSISDEISE